MDKRDYILLLNCIYPDFFEREIVRGLPEELVFNEMLLSLNDFDIHKYDKNLADNISFGFYDGDLDELKKEVEKVASFCLVEDMGIHNINRCELKIGGPGCVGTLPEYRHKGIGLTMLLNNR